jgi:hypothetical protein
MDDQMQLKLNRFLADIVASIERHQLGPQETFLALMSLVGQCAEAAGIANGQGFIIDDKGEITNAPHLNVTPGGPTRH